MLWPTALSTCGPIWERSADDLRRSLSNSKRNSENELTKQQSIRCCNTCACEIHIRSSRIKTIQRVSLLCSAFKSLPLNGLLLRPPGRSLVQIADIMHFIFRWCNTLDLKPTANSALSAPGHNSNKRRRQRVTHLRCVLHSQRAAGSANHSGSLDVPLRRACK